MNATLVISEDGRRMEVIRSFGGVRVETVARLELFGGAKELKQALQAVAALTADPDTHVSGVGHGPFPRWLEEDQ